jgi:hypothetical protein
MVDATSVQQADFTPVIARSTLFEPTIFAGRVETDGIDVPLASISTLPFLEDPLAAAHTRILAANRVPLSLNAQMHRVGIMAARRILIGGQGIGILNCPSDSPLPGSSSSIQGLRNPVRPLHAFIAALQSQGNQTHAEEVATLSIISDLLRGCLQAPTPGTLAFMAHRITQAHALGPEERVSVGDQLVSNIRGLAGQIRSQARAANQESVGAVAITHNSDTLIPQESPRQLSQPIMPQHRTTAIVEPWEDELYAPVTVDQVPRRNAHHPRYPTTLDLGMA